MTRFRFTHPLWLALAFSLAAVRPASGQVLVGYLLGEVLTKPNFNVGFEIGLNFATLDGMGEAERIRSSVFGLFADWRFSEHFHLGSGILPLAGRGAEGLAPAPTGDPAIDEQTADGTMTRNLGYIEVPLILKWAPKRETGLRLGVGPSLGVVTSATDRYKATTPDGTPYIIERDIQDSIESLDLGISAEVEWRLQMLSVAVRYTSGLSELGPGYDGDSFRTRTLTGTGRIYLGKKRADAEPGANPGG
jgi:hypothetical protein